MKNRPGALGGSRSGIAAMEFALVAPMMFLILAGAFDAAKAVILQHQVYDTAHLVGISATNVSVNADKTTTLSEANAQQSMSLIYATMPWIRAGIEKGVRSVTLTSVAFKPISNCTVTSAQNCYNAEVAFSVTYDRSGTGFTSVLRSCGNLTQIAPTATIPNGQTNLSVLRTVQVTRPDALIVVDVNYEYKPFFLKFITGTVNFWATDLNSARSGSASQSGSQWLQYTNYTGTDGTGNCPNL